MSRKEVIDKTLGEIWSFLDELSNGTSRYRSLHNLTEQVEHQYHGRFLIELIQNAHDALFEVGAGDKDQRIEIVLADDEGSHGALYIANDGQPFTQSNFMALSNLGQSDKDPEKSIGNKGIGFRSVLEITKAPEIYSCKERGESSFDGYCFSFNPSVIKMFESPIREMVEGDNDVESPITDGESLLQWDDARYESFRQRCLSFEKAWLPKELAFLSPYALPVPIDETKVTVKIKDFEKRGFSTVIRLPFLNQQAKELAVKKLEEIDESTVIFLQRLNILRIVINSAEKSYQREQSARKKDKENGCEVQITSSVLSAENNITLASRYWLWTKIIGGSDRPEERKEIELAVVDLPGKWPTVEKATVAVAVQVGSDPVDGMINIYLPTEVPSGCAAHFSAPFYGDMSRTNIDFEKPYNQLLLKAIAEKSSDIILSSLAGSGEEEAAAIIDILAPLDSNEGDLWWGMLTTVFSARSVKIESENIALSDFGWNNFNSTRLLPDINLGVVINSAILRSEATYPVFAESLVRREAGIKRIFAAIDIEPKALPTDNAATVEAIAIKLHGNLGQVDWNGFWHDVEILFSKYNTEPLIGKKIFLGTDNQLHACDDNCSVFFRRRVNETDEVHEEGSIEDIPKSLSPYIAFLHKDIQVHEPQDKTKGGMQTNATHVYLSSGLVETYRAERIFSKVLVKATPKLPFDLSGKDSQLCQDILQWGLRLLTISRGNIDNLLHFLCKLPVPCIGGWYPIKETCFGPEWPDKCGSELKRYFQQVGSIECSAEIERLLLPPDHKLWGEVALSSALFFEKAGSFNGMRLIPVNTKNWQSKFSISGWSKVYLPVSAPGGCDQQEWDRYVKFVVNSERPQYSGKHRYELQKMYKIPGFEKLDSFDDVTRDLLTKLLLISISSWEEKWKGWQSVRISKLSGEKNWLTPVSPLAFSLRELPWMQDSTDDRSSQFRPSDRWYIPSPALVGGIHQFSHLKLIPSSITTVLSRNSMLVKSMKKLGMRSYNPEEETTDTRLLNDHAVALEDPSVEIPNSSVFLGQVRTAWNQFRPSMNDKFPVQIIVQDGDGVLKAITPSEDEPVYLPDASPAVHSGLVLHSESIITMDTKDAKRLQVYFQNTYGNSVRLASELTTRALVNGCQWKDDDSTVQLFEELPWLISVVLSVFAFSGGSSRGVGTKTFTKAIDALRQTRIVWVESLEAGLWHADLSVARTSVPALWIAKNNTLLAIKNTKNKLSLLSEELASVVGRSDIEISLKLVLGDFERAGELTDDIVCLSLKKLHISQDQYEEVQQRWLGDLAWTLRLARPLVVLMQPHTDITPLDEVANESQLRQFFHSCDLSPLDVDDVMVILRAATGFKLVGYKVWEIIGGRAQLKQWNEALSQVGESPITNDQANEQFQAHLGSISTILRSIIRSTMRRHPELGAFNQLDEKLSSIGCPVEYVGNYWSIGFQEVMKKILVVLKRWHAELDVISIVENATSIEELRNDLYELGLEPDLDPVEIHADNLKLFLHIFENVQKISIAWCLRENTDTYIWSLNNNSIEVLLVDYFSKAAFVDIWNEEKCFVILRKLSRSSVHNDLWSIIDVVSNVKDLMDRLGISESELIEARGQLEKRKQKSDIQKKTVNVCGEDFINTEGSLGDLWDHIHGTIETNNVPELDLNDLEKMKEQSSLKKRKKRSKRQTSSNKTKGRMSQAMKDLVGLAGEIHAFRALQKFYGTDAVGPGSWRSENSRHKYPENKTDDGFGCDFIVHENGKIHYIEVKATQGENESFELGSTEVELAIEFANRRKKDFIILHVLNALTDAPIFRMLPNPYDRKHKSKYNFEEAGLRVRYEVS